MSQYLQLWPDNTAFIDIEPDPAFTDTIPDAYFSALVYVPSTIQPDMDAASGPTLLEGDSWHFGIDKLGAGNYRYDISGVQMGAVYPGTPPVMFDQWVQVEVHVTAGSHVFSVRINGTLYGPFTASSFWTPSGANWMGPGAFPAVWVGAGGGVAADDWIGYDELSWSVAGWISQGGAVASRWAFEAADPIADALADYPTPPWFASTDAASFVLVGGGGEEADFAGEEPVGDPPDPVGCCADPGELEASVFIDGTDVTAVASSGSWTPQLNGIAQATCTIAMDAAIGDVGDLLRIEVTDGVTSCIVFHGRILNRELDTDKDGGRVQYNAQDASEILQYRVVRDDDGDFSRPRVIEQYATGPQIIQAVLQNSIDSTGRVSLDGLSGGPPPVKSEGPLPIELGGFAGGGPNLKGAPVDWPMKISELISLFVSTGQVDCIFSPINPGGGVTNRIDVYNGNYGTDRSATVGFEYGTGRFNAAAIRWNRDMTSMVNKYQIFAGPQIETAADPKGEQHWCFNVTGTDGGSAHVPPFTGGLVYPPGGESVDATNTPAGPPWTDNQLGERIYNSRQDFDVRMQVDILDAYDDNCIKHFGTPGRMLTRYQWQVFSWLAAQPREIIHITPVAGTQIGCFHIGDLIHVEAVSDVLGGFSGKQRVYGYTVSWEATPSVLTLSEIQTSADNEGNFNA